VLGVSPGLPIREKVLAQVVLVCLCNNTILHRFVRGFDNSLVRVTLRVWLLLAFSCAQGLPSQLFVMVSTTGLYSVQWGLFCPKRLFVPSRCVVDAVFCLRALFSWLHVAICSDSR